MEEQKKKKPTIELKRGHYWLLLTLPIILTAIAILLSIFLEFLEYGIIVFIPLFIILGLNLLAILITIAAKTMNKITIQRLSEEIEIKNYETYSKQFYIDWRKVSKMVYSGKIEEKTCGVCKLPIHEKEFILQCPNCQVLFHGPHLIEWLGNDDACPLCVSKIKIT